MPAFSFTTLSHDVIENPDWRYKQIFRRIKVNYDPNEQGSSLSDLCTDLENVFYAIVNQSIPVIGREDQIRLCINSNMLDRSIWVAFRKGVNFTKDLVSNTLMKICQSKSEFLIKGELELDIIWIQMPSGGGRRRGLAVLDLEQFEKKSSKVVRVEKDGLCCSRALFVGKAMADSVKGKQWRQIIDDAFQVQTKGAKDLCVRANVPEGANCGIEELIKFHRVLDNYRIVVTNGNNGKFIYNEGDQTLPTIYLLYAHNHYSPIKSLKSFFGFDYFCEKCLIGFNNRTSHRCSNTCPHCFSTPPCLFEVTVTCDICNRKFNSSKCHENHETKGICQKLKKCANCGGFFDFRHICGKFYCSTCKKQVSSRNHLCYIAPLKASKIEKDRNKSKIILFYDIESYKDETGYHKPNLIVSSHCCDLCWNTVTQSECSHCLACQKIFSGIDSLQSFCKWLFCEFAKQIKSVCAKKKMNEPVVYVIAHNGRAYDFHFILKYINDFNVNCAADIIKNGSKIISMKYSNYKFVDSLSFLPMPLKHLPKAFGLPESKGWFPHLFNCPQNWCYIGPYPEEFYYQPDMMMVKERAEFKNWYRTKVSDEFDFTKEITKYCAMDVTILKNSFMVFRKSFIDLTNIDPLVNCVTIAQACMDVFKSSFLKPDTIAVIPSAGYDPKRKSSFIANLWLDYLAEKESITIIKEYKIGKYYADGYCTHTNTVFEFFGCFFHGCQKCYLHSRNTVKAGYQKASMDELHNLTQEKIDFYILEGYNVRTIWECDFNTQISNSLELNQFVKIYRESLNKTKPPLDPRDAFFGGRTNAVKLFYQVKAGEKIKYLDFTSLYPYVVKYCAYPVGHPVVIRKNFNTNITSYNGFILCSILPPKQLYLPVLPIKHDGKLIFPLCQKCVKEKNQSSCKHTEKSRIICGTWTTPEVTKALELGYKLIDIYEVWHFNEMISYDREAGHGGLFGNFIDKWIKIKTEASGWPKECKTDEEKHRYIQDFKEKEGIELCPDAIVSNPPLRTYAKLMANSFWGKFAQRPNLRKCCYLKKPAEFFKMLVDPELELLDAFLVNSDTMLVQYEKSEGFITDPSHSNIAIAAFTTAYARLKLYDLLMTLGDKVLYFDTDSVIFISNGEENIKIGSFLGELTDELSEYGADAYIDRFVSGGPKNYAFRVIVPGKSEMSYCCKVKGITLNFETAKALKFDVMEKIIKDSISSANAVVKPVPQLVFKVNGENNISTSTYFKNYRMVYDKRRIIPETFSTLPFGFVDII